MTDNTHAIQPVLNLENSHSQFLSFSDAAAKVLENYARKQPMHFRDITNLAIKKGFLNSQGLTPAQTMRVVIGREIERNIARGRRPRFFVQPKGFFGLTAWQTQANEVFSKIDHHNQEIKKQYLQKLHENKPGDFEILIGELLTKMQFDDVIVSSHTNDGGIDIKAVLNVAGVLKTRMAVQVKRWQNNVQKPDIQKLRGALGAHEQGLFITTSGFSPGAISDAARADAAPIATINGNQLVEFLVENEIGIRKNSLDWLDFVDSDLDQVQN